MDDLFIDEIKWDTSNFDLNLNQINVFKVSVSEKFKDIEISYEEVLSAAEVAKSKKYLQVADRIRFITSKYFLRILVSKFLNIAPNAIEFGYQKNKKPKVCGVEFNVSHSGDIILIAISTTAIGIDIESIDKPFEFKTLIDICFHPDEHKFLINNNLKNFYTFWTRKEALLKATGEGLVDHMELINTTKRVVKQKNNCYELISFCIEKNYVASIGYEATTSKLLKFWQL